MNKFTVFLGTFFLTIAAGVVAQTSISDMEDTWDDAGTTFDAIKMDVTDTASQADSKLIDLQIGSVTQFNVDKSGNVTVTGTVDGRDLVTDGTKLDGIEAGATGDQTGAEIKALYEAEADTNAYDDAAVAKLAGIAAGADVTADNPPQAHADTHRSDGSDPHIVESVQVTVYNQTGSTLLKGKAVYINGWKTGNEVPTVALAQSDSGATMPALGLVNADISNVAEGSIMVVGTVTGIDTSSYTLDDPLYVDPSVAGDLTTIKPVGSNEIQAVARVTRVNVAQGSVFVAGALRSNDIPNFTAADKFWYGGVDGVQTEGDTTADGRAVLAAADANPFTDAEQTKLAGIETAADVTDATNVTAAGAVMADGTGNDITGDLILVEKADHGCTPSAGIGCIWSKNDAPSTLYWTDDDGTDFQLGAGSSLPFDMVYTADDNYGMGTGALDSVTPSSGLRNIGIGKNAGTSITTSDDNIGIGDNALLLITTGGNSNIAIGSEAGRNITSSDNNILIGQRAGDAISGISGSNVVIGLDAGSAFTSQWALVSLRIKIFTQ